MKNFAAFASLHKEALFSLAAKSTKYNARGQAVITKDDPWLYEDEWDEHYKELSANDDKAARGVVC